MKLKIFKAVVHNVAGYALHTVTFAYSAVDAEMLLLAQYPNCGITEIEEVTFNKVFTIS